VQLIQALGGGWSGPDLATSGMTIEAPQPLNSNQSTEPTPAAR